MRIDFNRAEGSATALGIVCRNGGEPIYELFRVLTERGLGNRPANCFDERGVRCMFVGNIGAAARRYRPTEEEKAQRAARRGGMKNGVDSGAMEGEAR